WRRVAEKLRRSFVYFRKVVVCALTGSEEGLFSADYDTSRLTDGVHLYFLAKQTVGENDRGSLRTHNPGQECRPHSSRPSGLAIWPGGRAFGVAKGRFDGRPF